LRAHDIILDYRWTTLVGGHVGRLGVRADGDLQRQYIRDLDASVKQTMTSLDPTPFFQKYGPSGTPGRSSRPTSTPPRSKPPPRSSTSTSASWPEQTCSPST